MAPLRSVAQAEGLLRRLLPGAVEELREYPRQVGEVARQADLQRSGQRLEQDDRVERTAEEVRRVPRGLDERWGELQPPLRELGRRLPRLARAPRLAVPHEALVLHAVAEERLLGAALLPTLLLARACAGLLCTASCGGAGGQLYLAARHGGGGGGARGGALAGVRVRRRAGGA
eukprot:CAMPEP_0183795710 /NCGR_PEP_ID=MMETSP0803_2-20130417/5125_1 /TAXON_ID=195967 /ORGANISM="Crustomastix stigmata, Strain CCMP3273" /LENGTH=173 /DNA_ID=CAMNT_0026040185 /DNA_START=17 /DNA_END=534 /DNA_ORIENTATION=+